MTEIFIPANIQLSYRPDHESGDNLILSADNKEGVPTRLSFRIARPWVDEKPRMYCAIGAFASLFGGDPDVLQATITSRTETMLRRVNRLDDVDADQALRRYCMVFHDDADEVQYEFKEALCAALEAQMSDAERVQLTEQLHFITNTLTGAVLPVSDPLLFRSRINNGAWQEAKAAESFMVPA